MPQIYQVTQIARPQYYDRQSAPNKIACDVFVGAHAFTVRASYVPPVNYVAFTEVMWGILLRVGVPTTPNIYTMFFDYTPNGGSANNVFQMVGQSATTEIIGPVSTSSFGLIGTGDRLRICTEDDSIGGSCFYRGTIKYSEFQK